MPHNFALPFQASTRTRPGRTAWLAVFSLLAALVAVLPTTRAHAAAPTNIAIGAGATATSQENGSTPPSNAVDGDLTTRWASAWSDPQTLTLDLGALADLNSVVLHWEPAFAVAYTVDVSADGTTWTNVATQTAGAGGVETLPVPAGTNARYVRLTGTQRTTIGGAQYGYSLYEVDVLGTFTQQAVTLAADTAAGEQGTTVDVPVRLNMPAASAVTVHYATVDGTAVAGTDYTATSGVLTFPAGTTTQTIQVVTTATPLHQPSKTFTVALDTPTPASTVVGPRGVTTVTITNHNPVPSNGAVQTLDDFENAGSVGALFTFSGDAGSTPTLTQVPAARPGAPAGNNALSVAYTVTSYGGFGHDLTTAQDWTSYDGFSFWVKGTNTGQTVEYEVKAGGTSAANAQLWQGFFTDNIAGWQKVQIPFASLKKRTDYQPGGAPNNPAPDLTAMWGYAVNLPGGGASNTLLFDDVQVYQNLQVIQDFEGANPITDPGGAMANTGVFAWGGNATSTPALSIVQLDRPGVTNNHALRGTWADNNSYGGISYDLATSAPQDWSSFAGIEFWFYGHNPTPNPVPGSGQSYEFEVKDGGVDGEHAELWQTFITDDWQGWHLVQIPFSSLKLRTDYQPTGGPINSTLDLNKMYGFALTEPSGSTNGQFDVDQFAVYGVNTGATTAHITTAADVYTVDAGGTATVGVKLTTNSDKPLDHDVTVQWSLGSGSAVAGTDYTDATGTVTFT
ncbi:MAG: beta-glucosidase, partial [Frankiaceae bacterium]|nr:beta-glucosidase [Frankiaceae bacterium]